MINNVSELGVLEDVVTRLENAGFEYMLTGSMAMNYYAQPRMTRDIDIIVALTINDTRRIKEVFGADYYIPEETMEAAIRDATLFNLIHIGSIVKVDIIVRKPDKYRQHEFERRKAVTISGFRAYIASKEDLILSKLNWARDSKSEMQLNDVKNLLATSPDMEYIKRWAGELGVGTLLGKCLNE